MLRFFFISISFVLASSGSLLHGQNIHLKFSHITFSEGLSQGNVRAIIQDSQGFMWFGTQEGLNKYDGNSFTVYKKQPDDSSSICHNFIEELLEDRQGNVWIGTGNGLAKYSRESNSFHSYLNDKTDPASISETGINSLLEDRKGNLWIGTSAGALDLFDPENDQFIHFDPIEGNNLPVNALLEDKEGNLWVGTNKGLSKLDQGRKHFTCYYHNPQDKFSLSGDFIEDIFQDRNGNLWIATNGGGLNLYDYEKDHFTAYRHDPMNKNSISHDVVFSLNEDKEGRLWIGTENGGLCIFDFNSKSFDNFQKKDGHSSGISDNSIYTIYKDRLDNMWLGTSTQGVNFYDRYILPFNSFQYNSGANSLSHNKVLSVTEQKGVGLWIATDGGGINFLDQKTNSFIHYQHDPENIHSISSNFVVDVLWDSVGHCLWATTWGGGLERLNPVTGKFTHYRHQPGDTTSISSDKTWGLHQDREGNLFIGSIGNGFSIYNREKDNFTSYNTEDGLFEENVVAIYRDKKGYLWLGSWGHGVTRFDLKTKEIINFGDIKKYPKSVNGYSVNAILEDKNGDLWFAASEGLNHYNAETGIFTAFTQQDGLPGTSVNGFLEDEHGNLWLSTNKGIARFNPSTKDCRNFTVEDGLVSNQYFPRLFKDSRGTMYFGSIGGLVYFHPDSIKSNPVIPPVVLTDFKIFNRAVALGPKAPLKQHIGMAKELLLDYQQTVFSFSFAALNFTHSEKNKYAYKMEGFDKEWNYIDNARTATYTNLDPGDYTFRVKASNNDGVWNETGTSLAVVITPPYWQTWWFKTLLAFSVVGGALTFYKVRMHALKEQKEKLEKQVSERTQEVVAQKEELQKSNSVLQERQEEILLQREKIEAQHNILEITNTKVMDSISYANSIQKAILPSSEKLATALPEHFILYRPKDIVSGDFYWFSHLTAAETNGKSDKDFSFIAVIDCTGHGVPGAFMSIIGSNLLNEIVNLRHVLDPAQILEELDKGVMRSVEKTEGVNTAGMDVCLLKIEQEMDGMKITFSGAKRPIFLVKNGEMEIETIEADRRSIGALKLDHPFTNQEIFAKKGTMLYLCSDGYTDQNNPDRRKLGTPKLKECILKAANHPMKEQLKIFENALDAHQQEAEQRDDITLIGLRV